MIRRNGVTLVRLLVSVVSIILALVVIFVLVTSMRRTRSFARQVACEANVHKTVAAMREYATNDEDTLLPSALPAVSGINAIGIGRDRKGIASSAGASRSLFLLIRNDYVSLKAFVCPSAEKRLGHEVNQTIDIDAQYDFPSYKNLSYSYQVQKTDPASGAGHRTGLMASSDLAVYADRSPLSGQDGWSARGWGYAATPDLARRTQNSFNHDQVGQNVGFADGSVHWETTPQVGAVDAISKKPDNIWVTEDRATGGDAGVDPIYPTSKLDSVLWP